MKSPAQWQGNTILAPEHHKELELAAAVNQYHHGMGRLEAEAKAFQDYRKDHHAQAAAFHLMGMKQAATVGSQEDGKRHYDMYALHMKQLGHEPHEAVPPEVQRYVQQPKKAYYKFKGHGADTFVAPVEDPSLISIADHATAAIQRAREQVQQSRERATSIVSKV